MMPPAQGEPCTWADGCNPVFVKARLASTSCCLTGFAHSIKCQPGAVEATVWGQQSQEAALLRSEDTAGALDPALPPRAREMTLMSH